MPPCGRRNGIPDTCGRYPPHTKTEETAVSRYPFPDLNTLPEDIRARILEVQEKAGFIPNVFLASVSYTHLTLPTNREV